MANSIEMTSIDDQIPWIPQTEKDEIEEGSKVDHSININQIFAKKFKDLDNSSIKSRTIFKVNVGLRESNPDAYAPKMVSIGPYHKKNPQLHPMEKYKLLYLRRFLGRKEGLDVESCIKELEGLKEEALKCYDDVETDEFCQMLLLDGCFVVEFIRECCGMCPEGEDKIMNSRICIKQDLMLLENQLPFFVLNKLHLMTKHDDELPLTILGNDLVTLFVGLPKMTHASFRRTECNEGNIKHLLHVLHIFSCRGNPIKESKDDITYHTVKPNATELSQAGVSFLKEDTRGCYNVKHLLHLVHKLFCHRNRKKKQENNDDQTWHRAIPNATELSEAGVRFLKVSVTTTLFDSIKFEKGLMKIPYFEVGDSTEIFLRNLIAYEQQSVDVYPKHFTDFATFMDNLIESAKDVTLLRNKGIIVNRIGEDKGVTDLFNKIGNGVIITYPDFYYKEEFRKIVAHCEKWWNRKKANLKHNYFSSPWVGASTVAAIILLILITIQTILAVTSSIK